MSAKRDLIVTSFLTLLASGFIAAQFLPTVPPALVLSFFLSVLFTLHAMGKTPISFFLALGMTMASYIVTDRVEAAQKPMIIALLASMWGGVILLQIHRSRLKQDAHQVNVERDDIAVEVKAIKSENAFYQRRKEELSTHAQQRRRLSLAARELGALLDPAQIQQKLIETAQTLFSGEPVEISTGTPKDAADSFVFQKRQPVLVPSENIKGVPLIAAPISVQQAVAGVLRVGGTGNPIRKSYSRDDLRLLDILASLASLAMENGLLFQQVQQNALRDNLTGLLTHKAFQGHLEEALLEASRYNQIVSVILADVDHFKSVNDTHGHQAGDQVLQGFAHVLDRNIQSVDIISRYGGEEFIVLLYQKTLLEAMQIAEAIRQDLESQVFDLGNKSIGITASFGVATFPEDATSPQQLVRQADQRLYKAKSSGRNRVIGKAA